MKTSFMERIKGAYKGLIKGAITPREFLRGFDLNSRSTSVLNPYEQSYIVHSAVSFIAKNLSQVDFELHRGDDLITSGSRGTAYELFSRVNSNLDSSQLWFATTIHTLIEGEAFWWLDFGEQGGRFPNNIWVLSSRRFEPVISKDGRNEVIAWNITLDMDNKSVVATVDKEQVIHYKLYNPRNPIRGLSPLVSARQNVEGDVSAETYNKVFFDNNAEAGTYLTTDRDLDPQDTKEFARLWKQRHMGSKNAHKVAVLSGGLKVENVTIPQRDMQFLESRRFNRETIAMMFGVPAELLGFGQTTFSNRKEAKKAFWQETVLPLMKMYTNNLNSNFFPRYERDTRASFDTSGVDALQEEFSDKVSNAKELFAMNYPQNDINRRLDLGMEEVDWGDVPIVDPLKVPITDITGENRQLAQEMGGATRSAVLDPTFIALKSLAIEKISKRFIDTITPLEKDLSKELRQYWFLQRSEVLQRLFKFEVPRSFKKDPTTDEFVSLLLREGEQIDALTEILEPAWTNALAKGIQQMIRDLRLDIQASPEELVTQLEPATKYLRRKLDARPEDLIVKMRNSLRRTIATGLTKGETLAAIAERIRKTYKIATGFSVSVARTEIVESTNQGRIALMQNQEFKKHQWITAGDEHVRDSHVRQDDDIVVIGEKFANGLRFPADSFGSPAESFNCRCTTIPVEESDNE